MARDCEAQGYDHEFWGGICQECGKEDSDADPTPREQWQVTEPKWYHNDLRREP